MPGGHEPEYVEARRILLDALEALGSHRKAVVLVGAQAIYQRIGESELQVAPFTSDGDLALNPGLLDDEPLLAEALQAAGFALAVKPGTWARHEVQIDLLVPSSLGGAGRRSARLGPHGTEVARKAKGLEAAMIDNSVVTLTALDPADTRTIEVAVAGLGALLVAKIHKLAERELELGRWSPKDGLDVLRILQSADLRVLGAILAGLERHTLAGPITTEARPYLRRLFGTRDAHGAAMAVRAAVGLEDAATIAGACAALANELLSAWDSSLVGNSQGAAAKTGPTPSVGLPPPPNPKSSATAPPSLSSRRPRFSTVAPTPPEQRKHRNFNPEVPLSRLRTARPKSAA